VIEVNKRSARNDEQRTSRG